MKTWTCMQCWCFVAVMLASPAGAATYIVNPDGSGDFTTIQDAVDAAASGDSILVAAGLYSGERNQDIDFLGKSLSTLSIDGPDVTIIDSQYWGRAFIVQGDGTQSCLIQGFTIRNGNTYMYPLGDDGAGIYCNWVSVRIRDCIVTGNFGRSPGWWHLPLAMPCVDRQLRHQRQLGGSRDGCQRLRRWGLRSGAGSSLTMTDCRVSENGTQYMTSGGDGGGMVIGGTFSLSRCVIADNNAWGEGGGLYLSGAGPGSTLEVCTITGNHCDQGGGGLACRGGSRLTVRGTTISANDAGDYDTGSGGGILCTEASSIDLDRSILWSNCGLIAGDAAYVESGCRLTFGCSDVDVADIEGPGETILGLDCFTLDPLFCDGQACGVSGGDYTLHVDSPCLPGNHPLGIDCGSIGAHPVGCPVSGLAEADLQGTALTLSPAVPNPFATVTVIPYRIGGGEKAAPVTLTIVDTSGRLVRTLVRTTQSPGLYSVAWDGRNENGVRVVAGAYFCRLRANGVGLSRAIIRIR